MLFRQRGEGRAETGGKAGHKPLACLFGHGKVLSFPFCKEAVVKKFVHTLVGTLLLGLLATPGFAETNPEQLAAESEAYVKSTAKETPTAPEAIVAKVDEACALLKKEGPVAFPKFKGTNFSNICMIYVHFFNSLNHLFLCDI